MMTDNNTFQYQMASNVATGGGGGGGGGGSTDAQQQPQLPSSAAGASQPQQQQQQSAVVAQTMLQTQSFTIPLQPQHQPPPQPPPQQQQQQQQSHTNNSFQPQTIPKLEDMIKQEPEMIIGPDSYGTGTQQSSAIDQKPLILVRPPSQQENRAVVGRLSYQDDVLYVTEESTVDVGRNSSTSSVHFHVGRNNFISRKHFQILHDANNGDFYIVVVSKNGIFIDDQFTRKSHEPERLPRSCHFRFPSTDIRILFESFIEKDYDDMKSLKPLDQSNGVYSPLKIKIPKSEKKSPPPSPTGTLSAANSCPTSPRQSFRDYQACSNNNNGYQNDSNQASSNTNEYEKPLYSYAQLIVQSISASPEKQLTLSGIYSFITKNYPYYRKEANKGWQNSIRHNLSLNRYFLKVERSQDEPGKGSFWRIDPNSEAKLIDQSYRKRRQRGSQCFRTPYGMPRSAPASPSHMDNSRESSPLHDIVLQSAPGSPQNAINGNTGGQQQHQQHQQRNGAVAAITSSNVPLPIWPE